MKNILDRFEPKNAGHDSIMEAVRGFCSPCVEVETEKDRLAKENTSFEERLDNIGNDLSDIGLILDYKIFCRCRSCGEESIIGCEIDEFDHDMAYCGKNQHCLP